MNTQDESSSLPKLVIIDMGGQYTLQISTRLREKGRRSVVLSPEKAESWIKAHPPLGIILSGGHQSVNDKDALEIPDEVFEARVPILGLCYGMQALAKRFGGTVESDQKDKEFGQRLVTLDQTNPLFKNIGQNQMVLASHGDTVAALPTGFVQIVVSRATGAIAGLWSEDRLIWALQFHPESKETPCGASILENFAELCDVEKDWTPTDLVTQFRHELGEAVGKEKAILGYSGGVDSSTSAVIAAEVLKDRLLAVVVDAGQFRVNELDQITTNASHCGVNMVIVDVREETLAALHNITDSEMRRKAFQEVYVAAFEREAKRIGARYLIQGTLATDRIESGATGGATIKTHHNVGLKTWLEEIHSFRDLFKYEVRTLAKDLGLPEEICKRMPFPGPGLLIRIIGAPVTARKLDVARWADYEMTKILFKRNLLSEIDQYGAHLCCVPTTGVKGDGRSMGWSIIVRTIKSVDYMTAQGYHLPVEVQMELEETLTQHPKINRVMFDATSKPPATVELQ